MDKHEALRVREALSDAFIAGKGQESIDAAVIIGSHEVPEFEKNLAFFTDKVSGFGPKGMKDFAIQIYLVCEQYEYNWEKDFRRI